jgi:hypothetical protein
MRFGYVTFLLENYEIDASFYMPAQSVGKLLNYTEYHLEQTAVICYSHIPPDWIITIAINLTISEASLNNLEQDSSNYGPLHTFILPANEINKCIKKKEICV